MGLRHVFLDFGNTLVCERPSRFEIYAQAARAEGVEIGEAEMRGLMVRAHLELPEEIDGGWRYTDPWFRRYIVRIFGEELGIEPGSWDEFHAGLFGRFSDPETFELFAGAGELFAGLRDAGLGIGVISNWSPRLPGLIESLGLTEIFDPVVCSAIERLEKPSPEIFELALERAGVSANESLHAGDHPDKDCRAATSLGFQTVLVDHAGEHLGRDLPYARATSLGELKDHILAQPR